ncbi:DUF6919 domain-containing protein [Streptomyces africanus]|uniref:DUF6919 domain-containing protein n=1 Tax=Streptomyces africanus TaxID=231024 RepID=UPI000A38063C|nr:hypothetical protein [Streptomyces africanus]
MDRIWRDARSIGDLGGAMAGWLEGRIASQPGCPAGPDDETLPLVPVLARLNRRGWVTTCSQPGETGTAYDGRRWEQRAAVEGWISCRNPLLGTLIRQARATGLIVSAYGPGRAVGPSRGLVVTRWGDEPHTGFGGRPRRFQRRAELPGIGRQARQELARHGVALAVIDPVWGRDSVLWDALDQAIGHRADDTAPTKEMRTL